METRKITIANSRDQKKSVIMTAATTLGELKHDLDAAGINYFDMDFIEALTKTQLRGDDSLLPHDVPYNHTTTNELVFLLTTPNRKIKSGADRDEVYSEINSAEDSSELKDAIKNYFGRNYTMVKTSDLEDFLADWEFEHDNTDENPVLVQEDITHEERITNLEHKVTNLWEAMMNLIDVLEDEDVCTVSVYDALNAGFKIEDKTVYSAGMSASDIDELVASVD